MEPRAALPLDECVELPTSVVGEVAKLLADLARQGFPLVPTLVIPKTAFQEFPDSVYLIKELRTLLETTNWDDHVERQKQVTRVQARIRQFHWPNDLAHSLRKYYHRWGSEALVELKPSFTSKIPFQLDPELRFMQGDADILISLISAWASGWTATNLLDCYQTLLSNQLPAWPWLLQLHMPLTASGIAFTRQPYTNAKSILIHAVKGEYDESLSSPHQSSFEVDIRNQVVIRRTVQTQTTQLVPSLDSWVEKSIPAAQQSESPLTNDQIIDLAQLIHRLKQTQFDHQVVTWQQAHDRWYLADMQPLHDQQPSLQHQAHRVVVGQMVVTGQVQGKARIITDPRHLESVKPGEIIIVDHLAPESSTRLSIVGGIIIEGVPPHGALWNHIYKLHVPVIAKARLASKKIVTGQTILLKANHGEVWMVNVPPKTPQAPTIPQTATHVVSRVTPAFTPDTNQLSYGVYWDTKSFFIHHGLDPQLSRQPRQSQQLLKQCLAELTHVTGTQIAHSWYELGDWTAQELNQAARGTSSEPTSPNPYLGNRGVYRWQHQTWLLDWDLTCINALRAHQPQLQIVIPGARTLSELKWSLSYLEKKLTHHGQPSIWAKATTPQLVIELLTGDMPELAGVIFETDAIQALMMGVDPQEPDLSRYYQNDLGAAQHLIATAWNYLKNLPTAGLAQNQFSLYLELGRVDHRWVEWGVDLGTTGFVTRPELMPELKAGIMEAESQLIQRRYVSHT